MKLVDSHCHLDFPDLAGRMDDVLRQMCEHEVVGALCVGVSIEAFPAIRALVEARPNLLGSVGVHPDHESGAEPSVDDLLALADHPKIVAIGETGLDYYRLTGDLDWQRQRFRTHIRAARESGKPLIVHTRSSAADTLQILREERASEVGGVMHCFTETQEIAEAALDLGFHISFSGIVTFPKAIELKEVARRIPADRLLVETDSPYLAPVPRRGKVNQPAWVRHVAEEVARLRSVGVEEVAAATTANFLRLFPAAGEAFGLAA